MSALDRHLRGIIAAEGPIPLARFMAEALSHPEHGYYMRGDPLGAEGDFITAPEISQVFGELIGLWCAVVWQSMGAPATLRLVELGPGRGTLMADALRAAGQAAPEFRAAVDIHLVESSPALRRKQRAALAGVPVAWHGDIAGVPAGPALIVANEFFDALPIDQFERAADGWRRRLVAADAATGGFRFEPAAEAGPPPEPLAPGLCAAPEGSIVERRPEADRIAAAIARRLAAGGGAALVIDYGYARSAPGDTLQAVRGHRFADPLAAPGESDLTAHVDFEALAAAASAAGAVVHGPVGQGALLTRLGIAARAEKLAEAAPERRSEIDAACRRLIDGAEMGSLFKALVLADPALPPPPGFEEIS